LAVFKKLMSVTVEYSFLMTAFPDLASTHRGVIQKRRATILNAIQTTKKTGLENFTFKKQQLPINILSFWQWSSSELLGNALRGVLAEFIVASAIESLNNLREEWDAYDLLSEKGLKIEIKSSSYLQSWEQAKLSKIIFGIQPTVAWDNLMGHHHESKRQADIYIFCVLAHKEKISVNPLDLTQWDFYILDTAILNKKNPKQKTITLSSLIKLNPVKVKYNRLKSEIGILENKIIKIT